MISGGITGFAKAHADKDFRLMVKEAFDYALKDLGGKLTVNDIDGSVISYFSDHFTFQLKAGAMVQDFVGMCPKPHVRIEGGWATGRLCFQQAWESVASDIKIGMKVKPKFRRKATWSVRDVYFVKAQE
jgi:acetyl-CoA C-acetyltransferase